MSGPLEYTGERFTPECEREIWYEHFHRYVFALDCCSGLHVLDVIGIDLSEETIAHAEKRYGGRQNLQFQVADCTSLPFADDSFDRVVSFETLEHLKDHEGLMSEFRRVLKPNGCLLLSTPDKAVYSDGQDFDNEFHLRELYRDEFETLIGQWFPSSRLLGQKLVFSSAIWKLDDIRTVSLSRQDGESVNRLTHFAREPMYYIAMCAAEESYLPAVEADLWLFDDTDESVYTHYHGEIRRNMKAGGLLAERDLEIEELRRQLAKSGQPLPFWRRWFGKG
jgi:SAM-dependent methyltransferase